MAAALTSVKKLIACVRRSGAKIMITVLPNAFKNVFQHQYGAKLEHGIFNLSSFETFLVFKCFFVRIFFSQKCSVRFKLPPPSPMKSSTSSSKMSTSIIGDDWTKLSLATLQRPHQGPPSQRKYLDQSQGTIVVDWFVSWLSFNKYFFSKLILVCDC